MIKLNLGCGAEYRTGWMNIDSNALVKADLHHDLNCYPYPLADSSVDEIYAAHIIEHLDDPLLFMKECKRIMKTGALLEIRVPHCSRGFTHWEHKRGFDITFPFYFNPGFTSSGYTGIEFENVATKMRWFSLKHLADDFKIPRWQIYIATLADKIISYIANASPFFCSRVWCYWVGGFDEIQFIFRRVSH